MIYCPSCGTGNRDGSRFCNECGTKLPTMTSSLCPACGTPNPPHTLFCEQCGTRLTASLTEDVAEAEASAPAAAVPKGLSLPTKSPTETEPAAAAPDSIEQPKPVQPTPSAEEELPDWMRVVQSAVAGTSELDLAKVTAASSMAEQAAAEEVPEWLSDLGLADQSDKIKRSPTDELLPEWAQRLRTMPEAAQPPAEEEEVPDWLRTLGTTGQLPSVEEEPAIPTPTAPTEPPAAEEEEMPEWLKEPPSPYFSAAPGETVPVAAQPQPPAEDLPDWLRDLHPAAGAEDALPDWLDELGKEEEPAASESMALSTGDSALDWLSQLGATAPELPRELGTPSAESAAAPDWMSSLRAAAPEVDTQPTEEMPEWLRGLEAEQPPQEIAAAGEPTDWQSSLRTTSGESAVAAEEEVPEWLKGTGLAAGAAAVSAHEEEQPPEPSEPRKVATDWLAALRQTAPEMEVAQAGAEEEEIPEWLRETQPPIEAVEAPPAAPAEEEEVPEWLRGAGQAAGAAEISSRAEEQQPEEVTPQRPVTDWLSALRLATPEIEAEQAQAEEEVPEWMQEETGAAPEGSGGPQAYEQEVPEWLREPGVVAQPTPSDEAEVPEWLRETQPPIEAAEAQPSASAEAKEGVPEWLKGLGAAAGAAAVGAITEEPGPEEAAPRKPATDWLSALRQATPEMETEPEQTEEVPEWLREETGAAPEAIGRPQAYDQEVPDWLREETGAAFEAVQPPAAEAAEEEKEEGVPDWLKGLGGAAVGAAAATAAAPRAEEPSEEGLPDWLREETTPPQPEPGEVPDWLRETERASAITFETPQAEEVTPRETPDWLRELTPAAAATGAAMTAAEPEAEEIEQPAEPAEAETESWGAKAAPAAASGLAAAAVAGARQKPAAVEPAPAEMPEWLKEIRREQQIAKTAIPVPPPETTGLTQAEIPEWLEALRPTAEAAAPARAETPSETEGPLAGIANALPPAPIMGEMHGLPAKLQFAISAEDQARAGVLKELLTKHAVAPASVEQFVVKGSAIRRRALRWAVAFLIILAIFIPMGVNINEQTGLMLMPNATKMDPSPTFLPGVDSAAYQVSLIAKMEPNAKVLVVFDYDTAQSGELNRVATALLKSPALSNAQLEIASLNPQGSALALTVLKNLPDLHYTLRGFKPGQVNGVQAVLNEVGDVKLIIEVAASSETVRWWAEQLKANRNETPLVVGVSAGAEPLTMPYVQSGQVKGLVSGFPGAVAYLNATGVMNNYSQDQINDYQIPLDALTLVNYIMVALIVVGLIAALLRGAGRRSA